MIKKIFIQVVLMLSVIQMRAQPQPNITFPTTANPPNLSVDSYTRATSSINLQPGFIYGFVSGGATNLLNLNLSNNPSFVGSGYVGGGLSTGSTNCNSIDNVDVNRPVGETSGNFAVSPSGAATYNIPILVSPGTNNIEPSLSLTYNSQAGIGLLGTSWDLSGLSAISRTNLSYLLDNKIKGIDLQYTDAFALDGNRLFSYTSQYGLNGNTYYTELESYLTITSYGMQGNGPQWFEVKNKSGNTIEYGRNGNATLSGVNDNTILTWMINKITDEFGNYMTFSYKQFDGEAVIDKIEYTGNTAAGLSPYNSVKFEYMDIAEKNKYYLGGKEFRRTKILKSLTAYSGTTLAKKYLCDYAWDNRTKLVSVTETNPDQTTLHPTTFCWGDADEAYGTSSSDIQSAPLFSTSTEYLNLQATVPADFDGDGFTDVFCYFMSNGSNEKFRVMKNNFRTSYGTSQNNQITFSQIYEQSNSYPYIDCNTGLGPLPGRNDLLGVNVTDADFDNKQELYAIVDQSATYCTGGVQYKIIKIAENGGAISQNIVNSFTLNALYNSGFAPVRFSYELNDFGGTSELDELITDPENIRLKIKASGTSTSINQAITTAKTIVRSIDFDGDGVLEILTLDHSQNTKVNLNVLKLNTNTSPLSLSSVYTSTITLQSNSLNRNILQNIGLGDFNADGKTDLLFINETMDQMFVRYSDGLIWLTPQQIQCFSALNSATNFLYDIKTQDINNDGKSDITITDNQGGTTGPTDNYFSYFSLGDEFLKGPSYKGNFSFESKRQGTIWNNEENKYQAVYKDVAVGTNIQADYNGDGIYDVASFNDPSFDKIINNSLFHPKPQVVKRFRTVLGNIVNLTYGNILKEFVGPLASLYFKGSTPSNPDLINFKTNLWVVKTVTHHTGGSNNPTIQRDYQYKNAITHIKGRGFLGFEEMSVIDPESSLIKVTKNDFDNAYFVANNLENIEGKITGTIINGLSYASVASNGYSSKQVNNFSFNSSNPKSFQFVLDQSVTIDYINSRQRTEVNTYNFAQGGNLQSKIITYGWLTNTIRTESSVFSYILNNGVYKLQSLTSTHTQVNESAYTRTSDYYYDSQGHLTSCISDPTFGSQMVTTTYSQFNSFGSPTKVCVSAGDIATRCNQTLYDNTGRFANKKINSISDFSDFDYDPITGQVIKEIGPTGLTTEYEYDGLGRLKKTVLPNNAINKISYNWSTIPSSYTYNSLQPSLLKVFSITYENEGRPTSVSYYDGAGRLYRTETDGFNNTTICEDYLYRTRINNGWNSITNLGPIDVLMEKTEPYYLGQTKFLTTRYSYENYTGRLSKSAIFLKNSGAYSNQNIYKNYTYNNWSTVSTYNKATTNETDHLGRSVGKEFNAAGQNDLVKNNNLSQTETSAYQFNSVGIKNIVLSNNINSGQSITTTFVYDNFGRQTQVNDPSAGSIIRIHNSIGELIQSQDPLGTYTYVYDLLGRKVSKTGSVSGATTYQYLTSGDGKGKVEKITGPNSVMEFKYDPYQRLSELKETIGTKSFKTQYGYDNYGNTTKYTYPSNFSINNIFDSKGFLTRIENSSNQTIWQLDDVNAIGQVEQYTYGNGISTINKYTDLHYLYEIDHGNIHEQDYTINPLTGNLSERRFKNFVSGTDLDEQFTFDNLDRLKKIQEYQVNGANLVATNNINNINYNPIGTISHKDDAGDYVYSNSATPYILSNINNPTPNISLNTLNISYTDFRKVKQISETSTGKQMDFIYGNGDERLEVDYTDGVNSYKRYYACNYDRQETTSGYKEWNYIYAPSGICAVYYNNNGAAQLLYTLTDRLGSPLLLTTNTQSIVEEYSFDAWGRRRNPTDWSYANVPVPVYLNRGFTFHEHIDEFALINMNGRVYDPVLGKFIQVDNYVQDPDNIQNFNRYGYVLNNPLKYTDPDGNIAIIDDIIAAAVGGVINLAVNAAQGNLGGHGFWGGVGRGFAAFGAGAVAGYGAVNPQYGGWAWGGAVLGATNTWLSGGTTVDDYAQGVTLGVFSSMAGGVIGAVAGPAVSGISNSATSGISNGVARAAASEAMSAGMIGFGTSFALTYLQTGDLGVSLKAGALGMGMSAVIGGAGGAYKASQANKASAMQPERLETIQTDLPESNYEQEIIDDGHCVYIGYDEEMVPRYVGITGREPEVRWTEHRRLLDGRATLDFRVHTDNLTLQQSRVLEQQLMNTYGIPKYKSGGTLYYNQRNSIAKKYWNANGINP